VSSISRMVCWRRRYRLLPSISTFSTTISAVTALLPYIASEQASTGSESARPSSAASRTKSNTNGARPATQARA
jgi:hypothetical protein